MDLSERISGALEVATCYGGIDGDHHKAWVIDQMVRHLTGCPTVRMVNFQGADGPFEYDGLGESREYADFVARAKSGIDGPETYSWDEGIAP